MKRKFFLWIFILIVSQITVPDCLAQESTLWLRNGKKLTISSYIIDTTGYYNGKITYITTKGKEKNKYLEDVFSIIENDGEETILYTPNLELGEILTLKQMRHYVVGIGDARITNISPLIGLGGIAAGLAGAFIPQPEIKLGDGSMPIPIGILLPTTYIAIMGATPPNANKLKQQLPEKANNEYYLMGYQEGIKKKRIKNSLLGAGLGFLTGLIIVTAAN